MLVRYVRDVNRNPIATVVAVGPGQIGVAIVRSDERFTKKEGRERAARRAIYGEKCTIPQQKFVNENGELVSVGQAVIEACELMYNKAERYYANKPTYAQQAGPFANARLNMFLRRLFRLA